MLAQWTSKNDFHCHKPESNGRVDPSIEVAFSKPVSYTHLTLPTNREV